jgi:hypothetical protein
MCPSLPLSLSPSLSLSYLLLTIPWTIKKCYVIMPTKLNVVGRHSFVLKIETGIILCKTKLQLITLKKLKYIDAFVNS